MSATAILTGVVSLLKAVPIFDKWFKQLVTLYIQGQERSHQKAFVESLVGLMEGTQVPLEEAMGSDNAGKPATRTDDVQTRPRGGKLPLVFLLVAAYGCVSRETVQADIWQLERLPQELCDRVVEVKAFGVFRVIECKKVPDHPQCASGVPSFEEFIPYCSDTADKHVSMHEEDANKWLEKLTRPKK